jgi:hypothetical protein
MTKPKRPSAWELRERAIKDLLAPEAPPEDRLTQLEAHQLLLFSRLLGLSHAVGLHAQRVLRPAPDSNSLDHNADAVAFAYALRDLLREVDLAIALKVSGAQEARNVFDQAVPDAVAVRDVLVHVDDYMLGSGKLQQDEKDGTPARLGRLVAAGFYVDGSYRLVLTVGLELDVATAWKAAAVLSATLGQELGGDRPSAAT